jgi:hypothetical protein
MFCVSPAWIEQTVQLELKTNLLLWILNICEKQFRLEKGNKHLLPKER